MEQRFNMSEMRGAIFIMPRSSRAWAGAEALWITAGNIDDLSIKIMELIRNPEQRSSLSIQGKKYVLLKDSWDL